MTPMQSYHGCSAVHSERSFVGVVLIGEARTSDSGLRHDDFTDPLCAKVFAVAASLEAQGKIADLVTVCDNAPELDTGELIQLTAEARPEAAVAQRHAENIRTASHRRQVAQVCASGAEMAQDGAISLDDTIHMTRAALDQIGSQTGATGTVSGTDAMIELHDWLEQERKEKPITTGLPRLDLLFCGGLYGGKLMIVGARPSVGKSALLSHIAVQAIRQGKRVLYVSLEMGSREVVGRMIAALSGVSGAKMEKRQLTEEDWFSIVDSYNALPGDNFRISTKAVTPAILRREALRMKAGGGLDLVCVDYLQLMRTGGKTNGRTEEVGEISRALKLLAMELGCPVIAAAQVNRASAQGEERAPRLSELRESGSIEQDADNVIFLHRPGAYTYANGFTRLELIVAKNRQGTCSKIEMMFNGDTMRFAEVDNRFGGNG